MAELTEEIIMAEGGLVNDADDNGGLTKYGISQRSYPNLDIAALTVKQAMDIYRADYWDRYKLGSIHNQTVAQVVFFLVVNAGGSQAIKIVQRALGPVVKPDGVMGPLTLAAINASNTKCLVACIRVGSCKFYLSLVDAKPSQIKFFRGWIRRALS